MSEEISKNRAKFWLVGTMNGALSLIKDESGCPRKFDFKGAQQEAIDQAKALGDGYVGVVFEAVHIEVPELVTKRITLMSSSKIEAPNDNQL